MPIPSEIVLLFGGALTATAGLNVGQTIIIATAGSLSGAILLYLLGNALGANRLKRLLSGRTGRGKRTGLYDPHRLHPFACHFFNLHLESQAFK